MRLIVLLSTYNGEKYLREQLDSLLCQDLKPDKIFIRDDGSKDETVRILEEYAKNNECIEYYCGNNLGPAKSFFELINKCEEADYYSLCDQDDVWFKDKLSRAVELLEQEDSGKPLLYCSKYTLTDKDLNPINSNVSDLYNFSDFPHSLIYHTAPGCTFVFNNEARKRIVEYDAEKEYCLIHDAIIHKVVCMFGKMILDNESHMYYRQHGDNEIGMNADKVKVFIGRVKRFLNGKIRNYRSNTAKSLLNVYGKECSEKNMDLLNIVANYMNDISLKKELMNRDCFKSGTVNDLFFKILVLVNYI
ncbi:MAG: glycosyltransferase family 2 protein [Erysipelotrichaceae bacterium]|nr:glycosyltransferase family 2 protein [Erysipelotrichaceae bacterium]